jgi:pimeloyl-ACP methyl ester carboxylesterase
MSHRSYLATALLCVAMNCLAMEPARFDSGGVNLRYFEAGSGDVVVLLHGFGGSATGAYIEPGTAAALVAAGYRVIALDQRGHGGSDKPHDPDAYGRRMAEDVARLLDHLDVQRAHVIGYSMGGAVANSFRAMYPDRLLSVSLGGYGWPWRSPPVSLDDAEASLQESSILPGNDLRALAAVRVGMHELSPDRQSMITNTVPAFAIIGDRDEVVPAGDQAGLRDTMAQLEAMTIPGTHAGPDGALYKPEFAAGLIRFLDAR